MAKGIVSRDRGQFFLTISLPRLKGFLIFPCQGTFPFRPRFHTDSFLLQDEYTVDSAGDSKGTTQWDRTYRNSSHAACY